MAGYRRGQHQADWTSKEEALFKSFLLRGFSLIDIKEEFLEFSYCRDRSVMALYQKRRKLQQEASLGNTIPWTSLQDAILMELHPTFSEDTLSFILVKSKAQIQQRYSTLKSKEVKYFPVKCWTEEEKTTIMILYRICPEKTLEKIFGRSINSLHQRVNKLGITNPATWTKREKRILREIYPNTSLEKIMERLNRTEESVKSYASTLGLRKEGILWTPEEKDTLKKLCATKTTCQEMASILKGRTPGAVQTQVSVLGIKRVGYRWSDKDDQLLKKIYKKFSDDQLAEKMGRSLMAVRKRRYHLGLEKPSSNWTSEEVAFLTRNFHKLTVLELTETLNRSVAAIYGKAHSIGLKKLKQYTPLEDAICTGVPRKLAANLLNRTWKSIRARRWKIRQKKKPLSEKEISLLRSLCDKKGVVSLASLLRRTPAVIRKEMQELGLTKKSKLWDSREERLLGMLAKGWTIRKIAEYLGRSMHAVRCRIHKLKLDILDENDEKEQKAALACNFILRTLTGIGPELHHQFGTKRYTLCSIQKGDRTPRYKVPLSASAPAMAVAYAEALTKSRQRQS